MGNIEGHDITPVRDDIRKELNLSRKITYKQFCKVRTTDNILIRLLHLPQSKPRANNIKCILHHCSKDVFKHSFLPIAIRGLNALPQLALEATSLDLFWPASQVLHTNIVLNSFYPAQGGGFCFVYLMHIFTTCKRSLGQGYIFTSVCHSVHS